MNKKIYVNTTAEDIIKQETQDFNFASSFYLFSDLPKGWGGMEDEKLFEEIEQVAWQPFEHWSGEDIYNEINKLASATRRYIEEQNSVENKPVFTRTKVKQ
jgi:hypothetical protein